MFMFFVGIDISMNHFVVSILDSHGNIIDKFKLLQNAHHFNKLSTRLIQLADPKQIAIAIESSSNYHINLLSYLIANDFNVTLINPILIHNFRKFDSLRKSKTDRIDSLTIARFIFKNPDAIKSYTIDDSIKLIARERENLVKETSRLKNQIRQLVFNIFKELGDHYNILTKTWLNFLLNVPSARVARQLGVEGIQNVIDTITKGRGRKIKVTPPTILYIANNTISIDDPEREFLLRSKIRRLFYLQQEIEALTTELLSKIRFFRQEEMKILTSIPGIGELSASVFLAEVQDIRRFGGHYRKLVAFSGLDPVIYESGNYMRKLKISKRGSPHLRRIIWEMTIGSIFNTEMFKRYYRKKRAEGKSHKETVIATSNKLLRVIFHLLSHGETFRDLSPQIIHS